MNIAPEVHVLPKKILVPRSISKSSIKPDKSDIANGLGLKAPIQQSFSEQTSSATLVNDESQDISEIIDYDVPDEDLEAELERERRESLSNADRILEELARRDAEWETKLVHLSMAATLR